MSARKEATLTRYPQGGYLLKMADGSEYEADTQSEAFSFARGEGVTRVYSVVNPTQFVQLSRED